MTDDHMEWRGGRRVFKEIDIVDIEDDALLATYRQHFQPSTGVVGTPEDDFAISHTINFARRLLRGGHAADVAQAETILDRLLDRQEANRGRFQLRTGNPANKDRNTPVFVLPHLSRLIRECRSSLRDDLAARLDAAFDLTVTALERRWDEEIFVPHRDFKYYSNIFVEYARNLLLASELREDDRLRRKSEAQWTRWFNHVAYHGVDEFMSPRYSEIDIDAVADMHERTSSERIRRQCALVLDYLFAAGHGSHHPRLEMPVCGASRDYRQYRVPGQGHLAYVGGESVGSYRAPTSVLQEYRERVFPFEMRGRATNVPFQFRSWQIETAGVGSATGGNYFPQSVMCMASVGRGPEERAFMSMPGLTSFVNGFVDHQGPEAFCVFGRTPTSLTRAERSIADAEVTHRDLTMESPSRAIYRWVGTIAASPNWDQVANEAGRLVLRAYGHDVYIFPYFLEGDAVMPAQLRKGPPLEEGDAAADGLELYYFDHEPDWFGFHLVLADEQARCPAPSISLSRTDRVTTWRCGTRFSVRLFEYPTGEVRELYDFDWRTTPLLECPGYTLWPGELAARSADFT
ncbi:MAG: hypothetical protein CMJ18_02965 [Phycisphaeraceae bacterium]|nr:hypothetical protein [Phycisphaeraceae bacterium]